MTRKSGQSNSEPVRSDGLSDAIASLGGSNGLQNPYTGMGTARDKTTYTSVATQRYLQEQELNDLYNIWLPRKVVDLIADEVTREGWQVVFGGKDAKAEEVPGVEQALDDLETYYIFNEAIKTARHFGGCGVVLYINDGRGSDEPVDESNIQEITGMGVVDRWRLLPSANDYARGTASNPEFYVIYSEYGREQVTIHHSRVLRFEGLRVPYRERQRNQGWGLSVLQPIYDSFRFYFSGINSASAMLTEFDLFVHKVKGLANLLAAGKETEVRGRLTTNEMSRSVYRGMVIDADKEEVNFMSRSLGGVSEIIKALKNDVVAASGIPHTLLFGESPSGLGATGRSEERDFAKMCHSYQEQHIRRPLQQLLMYLFKSKNGPTRGRVPRNWDIRFRPLFILNEREESDLRARTAATDLRYIQAGVLTPQEIAMSRFGGANYSIETVMDWNLRNPDGSLKDGVLPINQPGNMPGGGKDPTNNEQGSLEMEGQKTETTGRMGLNEDRADSTPVLKAKGKPLSTRQLNQIAEVDEEDIQLAVEDWKKSAPSRFTTLLEADIVESANEEAQ